MNVTALIVGIDGWERYTRPLIDSIRQHEPECEIMVVDNASTNLYPVVDGHNVLRRNNRISYAKAINLAHLFNYDADWCIVLSNDVLCTGPFIDILSQYDGADLVGPDLKNVLGFDYLEGWCVAASRQAWDTIGGWDEDFQGSDWEDVDFSTTARERGIGLVGDPDFPFIHLDQRQRYHIVPDFAATNAHNQALFMRKHAVRVTA